MQLLQVSINLELCFRNSSLKKCLTRKVLIQSLLSQSQHERDYYALRRSIYVIQMACLKYAEFLSIFFLCTWRRTYFCANLVGVSTSGTELIISLKVVSRLQAIFFERFGHVCPKGKLRVSPD